MGVRTNLVTRVERERGKEENILAEDETTDHLSCYPALPQLGHLY